MTRHVKWWTTIWGKSINQRRCHVKECMLNNQLIWAKILMDLSMINKAEKPIVFPIYISVSRLKAYFTVNSSISGLIQVLIKHRMSIAVDIRALIHLNIINWAEKALVFPIDNISHSFWAAPSYINLQKLILLDPANIKHLCNVCTMLDQGKCKWPKWKK